MRFKQFLISLLLLASTAVVAQAPTDVKVWPYRVQVTVLNGLIPQVNYPVLLDEVNTKVLIDAFKMDHLGRDIRFALDCEGTQPLNYWIEEGINTNSTDIWVNMPALLPGANTIFMFYGNHPSTKVSGAPFASNFSTTMPNQLIIPASSTLTLAGVVPPVDWFEIEPGGTLNLLGPEPVQITARRAKINGNIVGDGMGYPGGPPQFDGQEPPLVLLCDGFGTADITGPGGVAGAAGGGYGNFGGNGAPAGGGSSVGGCAYGAPNNQAIMSGSGGGGGASTAGGAGGVGLNLNGGGKMTIDATISVNGAPGVLQNGLACLNGNAGGGAGGGILLRAKHFRTSANTFLNAIGGDGGKPDLCNGGGGGAGGRIKVFYSQGAFNGQALVFGGLASGAGAAQDGGVGTTFESMTYNSGEPVGMFGPESRREIELVLDRPDPIYCDGELACFTGSTGYSNYEFFVNGASVQGPGPGNTYCTMNLNDGDSIYVVGSTGACNATSDTTEVTINPLPVVTANAAGPYCGNGRLDTLSATPVGGFWSGLGIVDSGLGTFDPKIIPAGSYQHIYRYVDTNGCTNRDTITINVIAPPNPAIDPAGPYCPTVSSVVLTAATAGGQWLGNGIVNSTSGEFSPMVATPGLHNITYHAVGATGCRDTGTRVIEVYPYVNANITVPPLICESDTPFPMNAGIPGGVWGGVGIVDGNLGIFDASVALKGTHAINYLVTDGNGCTGFDTVFVTVRAAVFADAGKDKTYCDQLPITIGGNPSASGGVLPYFYTWSPPQGLSTTTGPNPIATPAVRTMYTLTVRDTFGCKAIDSAEVDVASFLNVSAGPDRTICDGASVLIGDIPTASGGRPGYGYEWSPSTGLSFFNVPAPSASPSANTCYTVKVTDAGGCVNFDTTCITVLESPIAHAGGIFPSCDGVGVTIGANPAATKGLPPYTYAWNPPPAQPTIPRPYVNPLSNTTYTLTVTDAKGCSSTDSARVIANNDPVAHAGPDIFVCPADGGVIGGVPTATAGTPPYTYKWLKSATINNDTIANPIAKPSVPTTYTVIVTDAAGCDHEDSVRVRLYPQPSAHAGRDTTLCKGASTIMGSFPAGQGGTPPYQYQWSPAPTGPPAVPNPSTNPPATTQYTLTVQDANGCQASDFNVITIIEEIPADIVGLQGPYCIDDPTPVKLVGLPAGGFFSGPGIIDSGESFSQSFQGGVLPIPDNNPQGLVTSFIVAGAPGVTLGQDIYLGSVDLDIEHDFVGDLRVTLISPSGMSIRLIDRAGIPVPSSKGCSGDDIRACIITGANFPGTSELICTDATPAIDGTFTAIDNLAAVNDGVTNVAGVWQLVIRDYKAGDVGRLKGWSLNFGTPGYFQPSKGKVGGNALVYTHNDCFDCEAVTTRIAVVNSLPIVDAGADLVICEGDAIAIGGGTVATGASPFSYVWGPNIDLSSRFVANPIASPNSSTSYTVLVTDANGCKARDTMELSVSPNPTAGFQFSSLGWLVTFTNTSTGDGLTYSWDFGDLAGGTSTKKHPQYDYGDGGSYLACLTVTNAQGCQDVFCNTLSVTSIEDVISGVTAIEIYPNPSAGLLHVSFEGQIRSQSSLALYNATGKLVREVVLEPGTTSDVFAWDLNDLAAGTYMLRITGDGGSMSEQVILTK